MKWGDDDEPRTADGRTWGILLIILSIWAVVLATTFHGFAMWLIGGVLLGAGLVKLKEGK